MSVQVSLKKQFFFGLILIIVLLSVIETSARVYDFYNPNCKFIDSDVYKDISLDLKRQICFDNTDIKFEENPYRHNVPNQQMSTITINQFGFRGSDISLEKEIGTYRIFLVGGSSVFGVGTIDEETIPSYLQIELESRFPNKNIQVINAGVPGIHSYTESMLIENKIFDFDPDMIIVYDGWNDIQRPFDKYYIPGEFNEINNYIRWIVKNDVFKTGKVILKSYFSWKQDNFEIDRNFDATLIEEKVGSWKKTWIKTCEVSKEKKIDMLILLQPILGSSDRNLSEHELSNFEFYHLSKLTEQYKNYYESLTDLNDHCSEAIDFRNLFDGYDEAIFFDEVHTGNLGNKIISERISHAIQHYL